LCGAGGVDFEDDAVVVGDGLDVGLDDGSADFVVAGAGSLFLVVGEDALAVAAALEGRAAVQLLVDLEVEVLPRSDWAGQFVGLVDLPVRFEDESHPLWS
jgi:hypothetical protein